MINTRANLLIAVSLLSGAGAFGQAPAAEKVQLKGSDDRVGDVVVRGMRGDLDMEFKYFEPGADTWTYETPHRLHRAQKYTDTVLQAANGAATRFTRHYSVARTGFTNDPVDPPKSVAESKQGKTLTIQFKGKKPSITVAKGKLSSADMKELVADLRPTSWDGFFPTHPVGPGDEWSLEGAPAAAIVGARTGKMTARVEEIAYFQGRRCARVSLTFDVKATMGGDLPLAMKGSGELQHALDLHRDLSFSAKGEAVVRGGKQKVQGKTYEVEGDGTWRFSATVQVMKLGGKLVKPPPGPPTVGERLPGE